MLRFSIQSFYNGFPLFRLWKVEVNSSPAPDVALIQHSWSGILANFPIWWWSFMWGNSKHRIEFMLSVLHERSMNPERETGSCWFSSEILPKHCKHSKFNRKRFSMWVKERDSKRQSGRPKRIPFRSILFNENKANFIRFYGQETETKMAFTAAICHLPFAIIRNKLC